MDKFKIILICLLLYSSWHRHAEVQEVRDPTSQPDNVNYDPKYAEHNPKYEENDPKYTMEYTDDGKVVSDYVKRGLDFVKKKIEFYPDVVIKFNNAMKDLRLGLGGMWSGLVNKTLTMVPVESVHQPYLSEQQFEQNPHKQYKQFQPNQDKQFIPNQDKQFIPNQDNQFEPNPERQYLPEGDYTRPRTRFREERIDEDGPVKKWIMATLIGLIERWLQSMWRTMEVILTYAAIGSVWTVFIVLFNAIRHKKANKKRKCRNYYIRQRIDQNEYAALWPSSGESLSPPAELHDPDKKEPTQWKTELKDKPLRRLHSSLQAAELNQPQGPLETGCKDFTKLNGIPDDCEANPDINVDTNIAETLKDIDDDTKFSDIDVTDYSEGYAEPRAPLCEPEDVDDLDTDDCKGHCTEDYGLTQGPLETGCQDLKELNGTPDDHNTNPDINVDDASIAETLKDIDDDEFSDIDVTDYSEGYAELRAPLCEPEAVEDLDMDDYSEEYGLAQGPLETGCQDLKELNGMPDDQNTNPDINVDDASIAETLKDIDDDTKFSDIDVTDYSEGYAELRAPLCEPEAVDDLDMDDCTEEYGLTQGPLETGCHDLKELNGMTEEHDTNPDINVDDASIAETLKDIDDDTKFSNIDVTDYSEGPLDTGCQDCKELNGMPDGHDANPDINVDDANIAKTLRDIDDDTKFSDIDDTDYYEGYAELRAPLCEPDAMDDLDMDDWDFTEDYGLTQDKNNVQMQASLCEPEDVDDLELDDMMDDCTEEHRLTKDKTNVQMQAPLCEPEYVEDLDMDDSMDECDCREEYGLTQDEIQDRIKSTMEEIKLLMLENQEGLDELKEGLKVVNSKQIDLKQQEAEDSSVPQGTPCDMAEDSSVPDSTHMEGERRGRKRFPKVREAWKRCKKVFRCSRN